MAHQVHQLIGSLEEAEQKEFMTFLASPWFNKREDVRQLAEYLMQRDKPVDKIKLYRRIYKKANYNDTRWRQLNSYLLSLLEAFFVEKDRKALPEGAYRLRLLKAVRNRRFPLRYAANLRRLKKEATTLPDGIERANFDFEAHWESAQADIEQRKLAVQKMEEVRNSHERAFVLRSLSLACHALASQTISAGQLDQRLLQEALLLRAQPEQLAADPILALYYYCFKMLEDPSNDTAFIAFQGVLPVLDRIPKQEARDLTLMAVNYCIRRVNLGKTEAGIAALDLYTRGLEREYLLDRGRVSRFTFSNIIAFALKAGALDRARNFLDRYGDLLDPTIQQSTLALNRARLAYAEGQWERSLEHLQSVSDQNVITTLNTKILQMRVYHLLAENRLLDAHLDAMDIYLRRRKDAHGYHYKVYRKLVSYMRKYRKLNHLDKTAVAKFRTALEAEERFPEQGWILSILNN
ncbi:MAG: hypothetical protein AAF828_11075 [Bacteroidota bacterium]